MSAGYNGINMIEVAEGSLQSNSNEIKYRWVIAQLVQAAK